jgi:hypothetical protein
MAVVIPFTPDYPDVQNILNQTDHVFEIKLKRFIELLNFNIKPRNYEINSNLKKLDYTIFILLCVLCFYIIFGFYELIINFSPLIINYVMVLQYISILIILPSLITTIQLLKYKIQNDENGKNIFFSLIIFILSFIIHIGLFISIIIVANIMYDKSKLIFSEPIDMIIFTFSVIFSFFGPLVITLILYCFYYIYVFIRMLL